MKMCCRKRLLEFSNTGFWKVCPKVNRLCDLVVRVSGYGSRGPGSDSRHYQIFWDVSGLKQGPLSLMSTIGMLFERKSSGSGLENREYDRKDPSRWPHDTLYPQKLALTPLTSGFLSVGVVRSRTEAKEFICVFMSKGLDFILAYRWIGRMAGMAFK
jgi:hypothetical protein